MRISEVTVEIVVSHARAEEEPSILVQDVYMPAALQHLEGYTGLTAAELDEREDMTVAYLALCTSMIDNRSTMTDKSEVNRVVSAIADKYCINLI